jgi:fluoride exporter
MSLTTVLLVAMGGAAGSVLRYLAGLWLAPLSASFPWATLAVNVLGALLLGMLLRYFAVADADQAMRLALTTGFCGGFTTFSALSAETVQLLQQGRAGRAFLYVALTLVLGLSATALGLALGGPRGGAMQREQPNATQ